MDENEADENSGMPKPFGGYSLTDADRAKGREVAKIANSGPRFNSRLNKFLKRKANVRVSRAMFSELEQPLFDAITGWEQREADPDTGEGSALTNLDVLVVGAIIRAHTSDRAFTTIADRVEGKPVQEIKTQGRVVLDFNIPPEMQKLMEDAEQKPTVIEADFEVEGKHEEN